MTPPSWYWRLKSQIDVVKSLKTKSHDPGSRLPRPNHGPGRPSFTSALPKVADARRSVENEVL